MLPLLAACGSFVLAVPTFGGVTDVDVLNDAKTPGEVVSYVMGPHQHRFSCFDQVKTKNVQKRVPAWSLSFGGEKQRGRQAQSVVCNGKIVTTASYSCVFAVSARTGEKRWECVHRLRESILPRCDVINRGAALFDDLVIFGTLDGMVVANQDTGRSRGDRRLAIVRRA